MPTYQTPWLKQKKYGQMHDIWIIQKNVGKLHTMNPYNVIDVTVEKSIFAKFITN